MKVLFAVCAILFAGVSVAEAGSRVSVETFNRDQARQDRHIGENARVNSHQYRKLRRHDRLIREGRREIRGLENEIEDMDHRIDGMDQKSRRRDAAILSLQKPMMRPTDTFGVEMGLARAGGETGVGLNGVGRISGGVYGTAGVAASGGEAVGRIGLGLSF